MPFKNCHFNAMSENDQIFLVDKIFAILRDKGAFLMFQERLDKRNFIKKTTEKKMISNF